MRLARQAIRHHRVRRAVACKYCRIGGAPVAGAFPALSFAVLRLAPEEVPSGLFGLSALPGTVLCVVGHGVSLWLRARSAWWGTV